MELEYLKEMVTNHFRLTINSLNHKALTPLEYDALAVYYYVARKYSGKSDDEIALSVGKQRRSIRKHCTRVESILSFNFDGLDQIKNKAEQFSERTKFFNKIKKMVCDKLNVSEIQFHQKLKYRTLSDARFIYFWFCSMVSNYTLQEIANSIGNGYKNDLVIYGIHRVNDIKELNNIAKELLNKYEKTK